MSRFPKFSALAFPAIPARAGIASEAPERILYSKQRFAHLDPGEERSFRLRDGTERKVRLLSVEESADSVLRLARRAEVAVEVDGRRADLESGPYALPMEVAGLRIQADTTTAWLELPKRVQLSLWDAADPIVDAERFAFPLPGYRLFSHGMQAYNEPVHLGDRDGDPVGQCFHHNYGVDFAGYEGREKVVSAIDGEVVQVDRGEGTLVVRDGRGASIVYGHLDSILSGIRVGSRVARGEWVGMLGRRGGSGNFSHLHVGIYLDEGERTSGRSNRHVNLYPWLVAAYRAGRGPELLAVARPHQTARVGETVVFDGTRSIPGRSPIARYEWAFEDGSRVSAPRAERAYARPGAYVAALWVEDRDGRRDVDFARVKVFSRETTEDAIPTLFATYWPTTGVRPGDPVDFRIWPQGGRIQGIRVDFGDGAALEGYAPYSAVAHKFRAPGIYVVTVSGSSGDLRATEKLKVVVEE